MRLRLPVLALLVTCSGLAATGCGGDADEKNAYVDEVQGAQRTYVDGFDGALQRLKPTSTVAEDRETLGQYAELTSSFVGALRAVDVPEDVRRGHDDLVAAVDGFGRQLQEARGRLADGSAAERARARTELSSTVAATQRRITRALVDVNAQLRE